MRNEEGRELILWKKNLQNEVKDWISHDRSPLYLLSGARVSEGRRWLATSGDLARFASAVAGSGGPTFLRPKTTELMLKYPPSLLAVGKQKGAGHVGLGWDTVEQFPGGRYRFSKNGGKPGVQSWLEHMETGIDWAVLFNIGAPKDGPGQLGPIRKLMYATFTQILGNV